MERDSRVFVAGIDLAARGDVFGTTAGILPKFGPERIIDTPISENAITGLAIGAASRGLRPVISLMFMDFIGVCYDQILNQMAKMKYMFGGKVELPLTVLVNAGAGSSMAAQHSQSLEALLCHIPGLKVVMPSSPYDAKGLLISAIRDPDPVIFFEPMSRYWPKADVDTSASNFPLHASRVVRQGNDVTVIGHGAMISVLLQAAEVAATEGMSLEVIDVRSLSPIDYAPILESVRKTGRCVIAQEAPGNVSLASELAATITEKAFYSLEAPVLRVTGFDTPFPPAKLEAIYLPDSDRVLDAVDRVLSY